jgi:hypothetical protein
MSLRAVVAVLLIGFGALAYYAWSHNAQRPSAPAPEAAGDVGGMPPGGMPPGGMPPGDAAGGSAAPQLSVQSGGDPGIEWKVPKRWSTEAASAMRLATYAIPAASGDPEGGRCAVYYFGPGQGGGTDANIERWIGEFQDPQKPERSTKTVGGLGVSMVRVRGTYLAHAGMGQSSGTQPDHELYGAIVEGPSGSVFFKLTGPANTVGKSASEFEGMVASVKKKS